MPGESLGTARGKIVMDYDGKGNQEAQSDWEKTKTKSHEAGQEIDRTANITGAAGLVIAAGLGLAVNSALDFEKRLSAIGAVSGATAGEMEKIREKALQIGKDTAFSATEAALAIEELSKAGISTADILNGAADATVALAAAGEVELPFAAEIASNAMNQFGLAAAELPKVADLIAGAANASAISVGDFGFSLSQAGAVANLAGVSFEDLAVAIALMGNAGIKGSDAGTSLKTFLSNLQPTTKEQIKLFKELGLVTANGTNRFFDQTGKLKSLADVSQLLQDSMKGMTQQQQQLTLETLFGSDAIRAAAIIAGEGASGFNQMAASMGKVTAAEVAEKRMDNLSGKVEALKGSLETVAIQIGSVLIPYLTDLANVLSGAVNWFASLDSETQRMIVEGLALAAGALLLSSAILKVVAAVKALALAMKAAAANPIGLIITAIALLVAGIIWLYRNNETARNIINAVWKAIQTAVSATVSWIMGTAWPALQSFGQGFMSVMRAVWAVVGPIFRFIGAIVKAVFTWFMSDALPFIVAFIAAFIAGSQKLWSIVTTVFNGIKTVISFVINLITTIIQTYVAIWVMIIKTVLAGLQAWWNAFWGLFGGVIKAVWELIKVVIEIIVKLIVLLITTYFNAIKFVVLAVWNAIKTATIAVWNAIKTAVEVVVNAVSAVISTVFSFILGIVMAISNAIKDAIITAWRAVEGPVMAVLNLIKSVVTSVFRAILGVVTSIMAPIVGAIRSGWDAAKNAVSNAWNQIRTAVSSGISAVLSLAGSLGGRILGAVGNLSRVLFNAGADIIRGMINGIESMIRKLTDKLRTLKNMIPGSPVKEGPLRVLNRAGRLLTPHGRALIQGMMRSLESEMPKLEALLSRVPMGLPTTMALPTAARSFGGNTQTTTSNAWSVIVNNPLPETATESVATLMRRVSTEGAFV